MSDFYFFSLTRPEHCWPFISSSYQASLPNVRCWLPKFDSKILITSNALQRDSNMQTPRTPTYGAFFPMVPFSDGFCANLESSARSTRADYRSRFKIKKKKKKSGCFFFPNRKTRAESHAIDATRHLYTLQYPVWNLSRLQMIHGSSNLALLCAPRECVWSWPEGYRNFNR